MITKNELPHETLDLMILHGWGIVQGIQLLSREVLVVHQRFLFRRFTGCELNG